MSCWWGVDAKEPGALFRPVVCERDTHKQQRFRRRAGGLLWAQWGVEDNQQGPQLETALLRGCSSPLLGHGRFEFPYSGAWLVKFQF